MNRSLVYLVAVFILSAGFSRALYGTVEAYELFVVGENGAGYHYDGSVWLDIALPGNPDNHEDLKGVWASAPDNAYAVGYEGGIYNYNGHSWTEVARPTDRLNAIWGSSEDDIYAAGENVYHYDGVNWDLFLEAYIVDVWGTSSDNIYFANHDGVYQYNGSEVDTIGPQLGADLYTLGIWASDENNVFLSTYNRSYYDEEWGYICAKVFYRYDGQEWIGGSCHCTISWPSCSHFEGGIWGSGPDNVWATGPFICNYVDECWEMINSSSTSGTDIWGTAPDNIYFCSYRSGVLRYDGVSFIHVFPAVGWETFDLELYSIWGVEESLTPAETPNPGQWLAQNHPNPFNPNTTISYSLRERGTVLLAVYDLAGRLVQVLVDDVKDAGSHEVTWDGRDKAGRTVASGVYFYRLQAGEFNEMRKMVLLR